MDVLFTITFSGARKFTQNSQKHFTIVQWAHQDHNTLDQYIEISMAYDKLIFDKRTMMAMCVSILKKMMLWYIIDY